MDADVHDPSAAAPRATIDGGPFLDLSPIVRMRAAVAGVNVVLLGLLGWMALPTGSSAEQAPRPPEVPTAVIAVVEEPQVEPLGWSPPDWFPAAHADRLWVLPDLEGDAAYSVREGPRVRSHAVIVADLDRGQVLYQRRADDMRPVASLTKLVSALAMASTDPDLDRELCVTRAQWPTRSGARSRFETGVCHEAREWLGAALVASDNRGAFGLAALSDLPYHQFVDRMQQVSTDLRMEGDTWSEPSGLEDDNMATARDMLKAVVATAAHPELAPVASAESWVLDRKKGPHRLGSTNRLVRRWDTLAAKTGYTDTARYCFTTVVRTSSGRTLGVTVLGAPTGSARFTDTQRLLRWAEDVATPEALDARER